MPEALVVEFDCTRKIGKTTYDFYHPITLFNYMLQIWTTSGVERKYYISIYRQGAVVDPLMHGSFKNFKWAQTPRNWSATSFSYKEFELIVRDISKVARQEAVKEVVE